MLDKQLKKLSGHLVQTPLMIENPGKQVNGVMVNAVQLDA